MQSLIHIILILCAAGPTPNERSSASIDTDFALVRQWVESQPHTLDNAVLFTVRDGHVVRSDRYTAASELFADFDGDEDMDLHDYFAFQICHSLSGPGQTTPPACLVFDSDSDEDIDLRDANAFDLVFTGSIRGVHIEAGELFPAVASPAGYYSDEPGVSGNNALRGVARQAGYSQDDLWYVWSVIAAPPKAGHVIIANTASPATPYWILPPFSLGEYHFELKVTNLITLEFATDTTVLYVDLPPNGCLQDADCEDLHVCIDEFCDLSRYQCDWVPACGNGEICTLPDGDCVVDSDSDGVPDSEDECPGTPDGSNVNEHGCALSQLDSDNDGVTDDIDACPETPVGLPVNGIGCPIHTGSCTSDAQCNDGVACTVDTCNLATNECSNDPINARCANDLFCDGEEEECDPTSDDADAAGCVRTEPCDSGSDTPICDEGDDECVGCANDAECDDDVACTDDQCEDDGSCTNDPDDDSCDDDLFCTGDETCDPDNDDADDDGCVSSGNPCECPVVVVAGGDCTIDAGADDDPTSVPQGDALVCNEGANRCDLCNNDSDCNDGVACTTNDCVVAIGICTFTQADFRCDDGLFCTGDDICDPSDENADSEGCVHAGDPCIGDGLICDEDDEECDDCTGDTQCDDGVACTIDDCDIVAGTCSFTTDDDDCAVGEVCDDFECVAAP